LLLLGFCQFTITTNLFAQSIDAEILRCIHTNRNIALDKPMQFISNSILVIVPAVPAGLFATGLATDNKEMIGESVQIGTSALSAFAITYALKQIIQRSRPFETYDFISNIGNETGYSMPSNHTAFAFAFATSISMQYPKWYIIIPSYLWATSVGYSRMHLGVHYLSDVLVGMVIGIGTSYLTYQFEKKIMKQHFK
jgi:membrane-associated phospholipid phosphatase